MGTAALAHSSSILHEYELPSYSSPVTWPAHCASAKLLQHRFALGKSSFPPSIRVAVERSCRAVLGDGNASLGKRNSKYRGCTVSNSRRGKSFGLASSGMPNGAGSFSIEIENSPSVKMLSLEDERTPSVFSEDMARGEELGRELLAGKTDKGGFRTSSIEISDSGANGDQCELAVAASIRIHPNTDEVDEERTPSSSSSNSQTESDSSSAASTIDNRLEETYVLNGDASSLASALPLTERYAPHKLFQLLLRNLEIPESASPQATLEHVRVTLEQAGNSLMFWKSWGRKEGEDRIAPLLGAAAFERRVGVSELHQWTATELALQDKQLRRIARDVLYLMIACWWVGMVRVAEAVVAAFGKSPPVYSKLWEATNSLDMFTIAWLAYTLRQPVIALLQVDPINLQQVADLKANIWEHMHHFYERQWKIIATLAMGRMLGLIATSLPSTQSITKNVKICWDMFLALPVF